MEEPLAPPGNALRPRSLGFVALGFVKPVLLLLGMVDLAAAVWTGVSLRRDGT